MHAWSQLEVDTFDDISGERMSPVTWIDVAPNDYQPVIIQHCHRARSTLSLHEHVVYSFPKQMDN